VRRPLIAIAFVLVAAMSVASVPLFILYEDDRLTMADAVIVLAGQEERLPVALEIFERGVAPTLVISDGLDPRWTAANRLCRFGDPRRIVCVRPDPYSTRGEARFVARLARERGWNSLVIVSSRFHLFRSRRLFERCFDGKLSVVAVDYSALRVPIAIAFEWTKLGVAIVRRGC